MKAIVYDRYGGPEVLQLRDAEKPVPGEREVLVRTQAVSLNPYDWHFMRGRPLFMRLQCGLLTPKTKIIGNDVAGVVEAVGSKVGRFKQGDEVFGSSGLSGLGEFVSISQDRTALKPSNCSMEEAACLNIAAVTALDTIERFAEVKAGQHVLVNGGSGGVGHYTIQMAKNLGAEVTAVCSTRNLEMVRSLGADHVIDYTAQEVADGRQYDAVIDTIGNLSLGQYDRLCKPGGRIAVVGYQNLPKMLRTMLRARFGTPKLSVVGVDESADKMARLSDMVEAGQLRTVIDRTYPLELASQAMDHVEQGHTRGKVVVKF